MKNLKFDIRNIYIYIIYNQKFEIFGFSNKRREKLKEKYFKDIWYE